MGLWIGFGYLLVETLYSTSPQVILLKNQYVDMSAITLSESRYKNMILTDQNLFISFNLQKKKKKEVRIFF